jgi:hypothetical protein
MAVIISRAPFGKRSTRIVLLPPGVVGVVSNSSQHNKDPKPFVWTKAADNIPETLEPAPSVNGAQSFPPATLKVSSIVASHEARR